MTLLCPYKKYLDVYFGKEGLGIHSYRIFNIAVVDVIFTLIGAGIISYLYKVSFLLSSISLFLLGIFLHYVFCVKTTVNNALFN